MNGQALVRVSHKIEGSQKRYAPMSDRSTSGRLQGKKVEK